MDLTSLLSRLIQATLMSLLWLAADVYRFLPRVSMRACLCCSMFLGSKARI